MEKKKEKKKKIKFSQKHPKLSLAIKIIVLLIILGLVIGTGVIVGVVYGAIGQDFEITEDELTITGNSVILDSEGNVLAELSGDENRKIITLDEMSEYLPKAYIAIEDERFEEHNGVDIKRTAAAIFTFVTNGGSSSFGGSTITQQVVKNITQEKDDSGLAGVTRKIKEWAKAYQIEKMLSKNQILELYLNLIFVGGQNYGVEVGAEYYFNKTAKELDLVECAFLAGINNAPNSYNPYAEDSEYGENQDKTDRINNRTKTVLSKMLELGYINQEQYDEAAAKVDEGIKFERAESKGAVYSYHTDATISQLVSDLAEDKGWSREYAETYVYGGGLTIYSTQVEEVQNQLEEVMGKNAKKYRVKSKITKDEDGKYVYSQAATVIIDNETGYVVGVYGGLGEKTDSRGLNRATQSLRHTGSSMKPIADLIPGIEEKIITAATLYDDTKTTFEGKYEPKDYNNPKGIVSVRSATQTSQNIPFVKIMAELTNEVSRNYLKEMGISTLDDTEDAGLSLSIGGLYNGISTLEMAGAYATIANDGVYRTPLLYTKVEDENGNIVYEPKQEERQVCSEQTAYIVKDILRTVVTSGTATTCRISGMDVAAKTGTSNDDIDRWLCGFTNYYTAATWYGFDEQEDVDYSGNPSAQIWIAVMRELHSNKDNSKFEKPDGIVTAKICSATGLKATSKCSKTYTEMFVEGTVPEECDEASSAVKICEDTNLLATEYCPNTTTRYYSYTIVKERLNLWTTNKSKKNAPTKYCTEHTEDTERENENENNDSEPEITLQGNKTITLKVGDTYREQGAKATDEKDGDISSKIQISGSVNTSRAGTYTITYSVTNSNNKTATVTRTIIVEAEDEEKPVKNNTVNTNSTNSANETNSTNTTNETNTTNTTNTTEESDD